ncbi:hypothetical protein [Streptomyces tremellae]|uniref:Uncharacterized protein n=1 Tax=Streptomyces tremellae TaxID=1124239 RepID=A0ABP7EYF6_9ACTN
MAGHKMITIGGVRYRPEDVPEPAEAEQDEPAPQSEGGEVTHKARRPAPRAKGGRSSDTGS